ncbi:SRPBCC domain-containing protein [Evansella sp. LMS18]|uniref:SRPBCC domain-containing protein n=1 Tax=Evansella sp. LMS18 TaxID=2924033 RepID=UPI0020D055BE|nr:SRPBCC domain-containing protein [Evansella sp. LMS18]UTR12648.1 SRPBCC domain-containing protein [Evansella sp. LMS18]
MSDQPFVYEVYINAAPEELWRAMTDGEYTKKVVGAREYRSEWKTGATIESWMENGNIDGRGKILKIEPPELLVYNWNDIHLGDELEPSVITYKIEKTDSENVVKLTVTHENLLGRNTEFWPIVISDIKSYMETGKSMFGQPGSNFG